MKKSRLSLNNLILKLEDEGLIDDYECSVLVEMINQNKELKAQHKCDVHNLDVMHVNFKEQYINCMKMIDDMKVLNNGYKNRKLQEGVVE